MALNPILYYTFNENSTSLVRDYSEAGLDSSSVAGLTTAASTDVGYDLVFDGTTSKLDQTSFSILANSTFSSFCNIKIGTDDSINYIFDLDGVFSLTYTSTTITVSITTAVTTYTATNDITAIATDTFFTVYCSYNSVTGALGLFINNIQQTEIATAGAVSAITNLSIGYDGTTNFGLFNLNEIKFFASEVPSANRIAFANSSNGVLFTSTLTNNFAVGDVVGALVDGSTGYFGVITYVEGNTIYRMQPISDGLKSSMSFGRFGHLWDTTRQYYLTINDTPEVCFYNLVSKSSEVGSAAKKTYCIGKDGVETTTSNLKIIDKLSDLPTAVAGVITLETPYNYFFTKEIDLLGDRLDCNGAVSLLGGTPELSKVTSTGLAAGTALLTSEYTVALNSIAINHTTALALDATANANQVIDWFGVNFEDSTTAVGTIKNYDNAIFNTIGFLNSGGLTFDGTIDTIAFTDTIFENTTALTSIILPTTLTVSRRFRIDNSSFVSLSGETALNVSTSATIPNEGYILNNVNFSGGGTYLTGVQSTDNKARFEGCRNIDNSGNIGQYFMVGNATATTISVSGTFYKVAGTTSTGTYVEKFDVTTTSNKAVYSGSLVGFYKVTVVASMVSGNNKVLAVRIAKNGTTTTSSQTKSTSNGSSRSESIMSQDVVQLSNTDYIEVFVANTTDTTSITVEDLNVIIERLN